VPLCAGVVAFAPGKADGSIPSSGGLFVCLSRMGIVRALPPVCRVCCWNGLICTSSDGCTLFGIVASSLVCGYELS
jgi:hypothetical protein